MNNKLEALIKLLKMIDKGDVLLVPYQLHKGIRILQTGFGSGTDAAEFLQKVLEADI